MTLILWHSASLPQTLLILGYFVILYLTSQTLPGHLNLVFSKNQMCLAKTLPDHSYLVVGKNQKYSANNFLGVHIWLIWDDLIL